MDIVIRLKEFIARLGISVSTFADNCGIPRPTLSQLLNGRNRKISNEVLEKIHRAYPQVNMSWLMFGEGDMFVPNANTDENFSGQPADEIPAETGRQHPGQQQSILFGEADESSFRGDFRNGAQPRPRPKPATESSRPLLQGQRNASTAPRGDRYLTSVITIHVYSDGTTQIVSS